MLHNANDTNPAQLPPCPWCKATPKWNAAGSYFIDHSDDCFLRSYSGRMVLSPDDVSAWSRRADAAAGDTGQAGLLFADAVLIAHGCLDYGGGYRSDDEKLNIFHHGVQTVINSLEAAAKNGLNDTQVAAVHAMGRAAVLDEKCPGCGHAPHPPKKCLNMASDSDCNCDFSRPAPQDRRVVFEHGSQGPCSACGDGDTALQFHTHGPAPRPVSEAARPNDWQWTHERDAELIRRDGFMCEQHPGTEWPHDNCAGPGQAWIIEGKDAICALKQ